MPSYAGAHDSLLLRLPQSTGRDLKAWFAVLDEGKLGKAGYLKVLEFLQAAHKIPHEQATAITYAYLNPSMVPTELRDASAEVEAGEEDYELDEPGAGGDLAGEHFE